MTAWRCTVSYPEIAVLQIRLSDTVECTFSHEGLTTKVQICLKL